MPSSSAEERRHVLTLLDTLDDMGGAETLAVDLATGLDPERFRRTLCVTRWTDATEAEEPGRPVVERLRDAGVEILPLRRSGRFDLKPWFRLLRFLRSERVDVLHAHKYGSNAWGVLFGKIARVPVIVAHEHMWSYATSSNLRRWVDSQWIAKGSSAFIAVSEEGRNQMIELQGVKASDVTYIPNGVPEVGAGDRQQVREELGVASDQILVGTLANLRPEKALEVLVDAAAVSESGFRVAIVGEGPERDLLEQRIADRGVGDRVGLLGYRTDRDDLLAAFDVAVCCSDFEGGPLSVMEYMDAGLPVVATNVGGLPELIVSERTGLLVPSRDPTALSAAIERLAADPALRSKLGAAGRELKRDRHGQARWIERMVALYDEVASGVT